ncbi:MAG: hypothetical protein IAX21_01280 [Candidatus Bathyarchaeota archaeon]|nr:MAG: hypothetical protein IAX21_01280 [Candidatus Bathyarchaeota archaeon]
MKLQNLSYRQGILLAFIVGFIVRLIPELLSFPHPIGWDTIYYASRMNSGVVFTYGSDIFGSWIIYGILVSLHNVTQLQPFMLLKIVAPLLYGGTCAGMFFVAWKRFSWSSKKSLLVSVLFAFQLAALAVSWQFYRNVFGVMVMLFALPFLKDDISWKETSILSVLALFTVWGHELAILSLFFVVFGMLVFNVYKKRKVPYKLLLAMVPALVLFLGNFVLISPFAVPISPNLVRIDDSVWAHPGGVFFLTDYLSVNTTIESYGSYFDLFFDVGSLFVLLYALLLPLIGVGYFKDKALNFWSLILLIGGLGCLVVPFAALFLWARWMLLLIYPFSFFAANGLAKLSKNVSWVNVSRFFSWFKINKNVGAGLALISIMVGALFMCWPLVDGKYGIIGWGGTFKYVPSTMQSSSVPLQDTQGVIDAYTWLNTNMDEDSSLLVHDVFDMWTMLYLDENYQAFLFDHDLENAAEYAFNEGYSSNYFVWWNQDISWYNLRVQDSWVSVYDSGRISVYQII